MKTLYQSTIDAVLCSRSLANEIRKMEEARHAWTRSIQSIKPLAYQIRDLTESKSLTFQVSKQMREIELQRNESIRKMLSPIESIRKSLMIDTGFKRIIEDISRQKLEYDGLVKKLNETRYFESAAKAMQESIQASFEHARQSIEASAVSSTFIQAMRTYEEARKNWAVPSVLIDSVGALQALQEKIGRLTLPVIDWASAATLAMVLGPEGLEAQLAALGIGTDGIITEAALPEEAQGIGLSRKTMELMTLLSFILALLVPIYQEISSHNLQKQTEDKLKTQAMMLEDQAKKLEALSILLEKAIVQESKRTVVNYVVLDRVVSVRENPKKSSSVTGKLLPHEVVRLLAQKGKWIQFEYYHWLRQEYQIGWALKKYFKRVHASYNQNKISEK